ncbi:type I DNA topoisomerase [Inquilinus sp.]|jgi:DNA topoisomerase-1|uniref:type I DNA topoisomerase n=1 Tax=Inquilinus sp. TaxID=1932117 RepID=UPI003783FCFB
MRLVIVESPGKVGKIRDYLGAGHDVVASVGHVRDLPAKGDIGVEPPAFRPQYVETERGAEVVARLRKAAARADEVFLATDPDREGEAIAWHLKEALSLKQPKRVTFSEITPAAVREAMANPRLIDVRLVAAQEARRVLDRLVGWMVSPELARQGGSGLSAGRVQSPAVRLVVERERAIDAFKAIGHFGVELTFAGDAGPWTAAWQFRPLLKAGQEYWLDRSFAERVSRLRGFTVEAFSEKDETRAPPAPFTTSTLQQVASTQLKLRPKATMEAAQRLYEQGSISYHRTDNPNLSDEAVVAIWRQARADGYEVPSQPRRWKAKDGAQEAHEAIRPAHFKDLEAGETEDERRLYRLVWERAMASQLADARYNVRRATLLAAEPLDQTAIRFEATGRTRTFLGWMQLAEAEDGTADAEADSEDGGVAENPVPLLEAGQILSAERGRLLEKKTKPPSRFTEATLVKALEAEGVGRPSTYASIMETIVRREYVEVDRKRLLRPTLKGATVVDALCGRFKFIDLDFTRSMEDELDGIAEGRSAYQPVIARLHQQLVDEIGAAEGAIRRAPTEAMLAKAASVASERGLALPEAVIEGYAACKAWLDEQVGDGPSSTQLNFARTLAERLGEMLDPATVADRSKLSTWIEAAVKRSDRQAKERLAGEPASERQLALIRTAIDRQQIERPEGWPSLNKVQAWALIETLMSGGGRRRSRAQKPGQVAGRAKGRK